MPPLDHLEIVKECFPEIHSNVDHDDDTVLMKLSSPPPSSICVKEGGRRSSTISLASSSPSCVDDVSVEVSESDGKVRFHGIVDVCYIPHVKEYTTEELTCLFHTRRFYMYIIWKDHL